MSRSGFVLAVVVMFATAALAQHSSGSSGSSGGGGGGGGSHSSGGGGSSGSGGSSGGSHSSGGSGGGSHGSSASGSSSHGSSSGGSSSHGSSAHGLSPHVPSAAHSGVRESHPEFPRSGRELRSGSLGKAAQPEKRGFFHFLRHPFRKPEPKPVGELRRRICIGNSCKPCPAGQVSNGRGGCAGGSITNHQVLCNHLGWWVASDCNVQTTFRGDCSAQRMAMEQQARRMQAAEANRNSCNASAGQDCSELASALESESNLYRTLQERYRQCQRLTFSSYVGGGYLFGGYSQGLLFDPLGIDVDLP